jgi:hypothetical protein
MRNFSLLFRDVRAHVGEALLTGRERKRTERQKLSDSESEIDGDNERGREGSQRRSSVDELDEDHESQSQSVAGVNESMPLSGDEEQAFLPAASTTSSATDRQSHDDDKGSDDDFSVAPDLLLHNVRPRRFNALEAYDNNTLVAPHPASNPVFIAVRQFFNGPKDGIPDNSAEQEDCKDIPGHFVRLNDRLVREQQRLPPPPHDGDDTGSTQTEAENVVSEAEHAAYKEDTVANTESRINAYLDIRRLLLDDEMPELVFTNLNAKRNKTRQLHAETIIRNRLPKMSTGSKLFTVALSQVAFSRHPLMTEEEVLCQKMERLYTLYKTKIDEGCCDRLQRELSELMVEVLYTVEYTNVEKKTSDDTDEEKYSAVKILADESTIIDPLAEKLSVFLDELHAVRVMSKTMLDLWGRIQDARSEQGFNCTSLRLQVFEPKMREQAVSGCENIGLQDEPSEIEARVSSLQLILISQLSECKGDDTRDGVHRQEVLECIVAMLDALKSCLIDRVALRLHVGDNGLPGESIDHADDVPLSSAETSRRVALCKEAYFAEVYVNGNIVGATETVALDWPSYHVRFHQDFYVRLCHAAHLEVRLFLKVAFGGKTLIAVNDIHPPNEGAANDKHGVEAWYQFAATQGRDGADENAFTEGQMLVTLSWSHFTDSSSNIDLDPIDGWCAEACLAGTRRNDLDKMILRPPRVDQSRYPDLSYIASTAANTTFANTFVQNTQHPLHEQKQRQWKMSFQIPSLQDPPSTHDDEAPKMNDNTAPSLRKGRSKNVRCSDIVREYVASPDDTFDMDEFIASLFVSRKAFLGASVFSKSTKKVEHKPESDAGRLSISINDATNIPRFRTNQDNKKRFPQGRRPPSENASDNVVESAVQVIFQSASNKTAAVSSKARAWNDTLSFPLDCEGMGMGISPSYLRSISDSITFMLFDTVEVDFREVGGFYEDETTTAIEHRFLGVASLSFSSVYHARNLDAQLIMKIPDFVIGYKRQDLVTKNANDPARTAINKANQPCLRVQVRLKPQFKRAGQKIVDSFDVDTREEPFMLNAAADFCKQVRAWHPTVADRDIKVFVPDSRGCYWLVCRFLREHNPPPTHTTVGKCAYFVSCIPFDEPDETMNSDGCRGWITNQQFLDQKAGGWLQHALLLCNYFLFLSQQPEHESASVYLAFGTTLSAGSVVSYRLRLGNMPALHSTLLPWIPPNRCLLFGWSTRLSAYQYGTR